MELGLRSGLGGRPLVDFPRETLDPFAGLDFWVRFSVPFACGFRLLRLSQKGLRRSPRFRWPLLFSETNQVGFLFFFLIYLLKLNFGFLNDFHSLNCSFPTDFWFLNDFDGLNFSFSLMGMKKFSWI